MLSWGGFIALMNRTKKKKNPQGINYASVNFYAEKIWKNQEPEKN